MSTYAIGDIQGCYLSLTALLKQFAFDPRHDRLWLVGDLVNRGPRSLEVLRWAKSLGESLVTVLGNHELHLLARAAGVVAPKRRDTLEAVLVAPDREALLDWLRQRPFLYREGNYLLVHGGLHPSWSVAEALAHAREAEQALQGKEAKKLLASTGQYQAQRWKNVHVFTRLRVCQLDGTPNFDFKGPPEQAPAGFLPWFEIPHRGTEAATVIFGHWAALGLRTQPNLLAIDTGCVWGKTLTAIRLEDRRLFQQPCLDFTTS